MKDVDDLQKQGTYTETEQTLRGETEIRVFDCDGPCGQTYTTGKMVQYYYGEVSDYTEYTYCEKLRFNSEGMKSGVKVRTICENCHGEGGGLPNVSAPMKSKIVRWIRRKDVAFWLLIIGLTVVVFGMLLAINMAAM